MKVTTVEIAETVTAILRANPKFQYADDEVQFIRVDMERPAEVSESYLIHVHFAWFASKTNRVGVDIAKEISDAVELLTGYPCVTHLWSEYVQVESRSKR